MGNCCCARLGSDTEKEDGKPKTKHNPFFNEYTATNNSSGAAGSKLALLKYPTGRDISLVYDLGRELGRGQFGTTHLCTDIKTGDKYACKSLLKKNLKTVRDIYDVRSEVEIMKRVPKHPNIVSIKDEFEDSEAVYIVMECCEGGELFDRIVARGHYTERAAASVMKTILEVVQVCHNNGVMHRDLKPENFLFANKKENSPLKAIDFGLSVLFKPGERFNEIVGSPYYMAPELLLKNYGPEVDIWSAGVILYIMLCGVPPFWAETQEGVAQAIIRSVIDFDRDPWPKVSDTAKDLVSKMLQPDPKKRLSAVEIPYGITVGHALIWLLFHCRTSLDNGCKEGSKCFPRRDCESKARTILCYEQAQEKSPTGSDSLEHCRRLMTLFAAGVKLLFTLFQVIADYLSVDEVSGIKEAFDVKDITETGKINLEELKNGLHKLGHPEITDAELQILMEAKMANDEHLHKAFSFFVKNQSDYIEMEDLREALNDEMDTSSEEVIAAIMHDVDTDKNAGWTPVPQFGGWDQQGIDATDYSVVFTKARANRKLNKADVTHSLGSEQELMASARRHHHQQLHHHRRETQDDDPVMMILFPLVNAHGSSTRWYNN
ncbi:hypothetical protein Bca101_016585 [Brassica carinata]